MASMDQKADSGAEFLGTVLDFLKADIEIEAREDDDRIIMNSQEKRLSSKGNLTSYQP